MTATDEQRGILHVCPNCGLDLVAQEPVECGDFRYDPRRGMFYRGTRLLIAPIRHMLMGALLRSGGATLSLNAIGELLGTDEARDPHNLVRVHLCRIRSALRLAGIPCPIESVRGFGLRWDAGGNHIPPHADPQASAGATTGDCPLPSIPGRAASHREAPSKRSDAA